MGTLHPKKFDTYSPMDCNLYLNGSETFLKFRLPLFLQVIYVCHQCARFIFISTWPAVLPCFIPHTHPIYIRNNWRFFEAESLMNQMSTFLILIINKVYFNVKSFIDSDSLILLKILSKIYIEMIFGYKKQK